VVGVSAPSARLSFDLPVSLHGWHASPCCQLANSRTFRPLLPTEWRKRLRVRETDFEKARSSFLVCRLRLWRRLKACARDRLGNGFTGQRMINPEYGPEPFILFAKPLTLLLRCF
jgi:hypothetical protein